MTVTAARYLEVNWIPLDTHGWRVIEGGYDELFNSPTLRGVDLVMPHSRGRRGYPRIVDATIVSIPMLLIGSFTENGVPIADPTEGVLTHRHYLRDNLGIADDAADAERGTVPAIFHQGGSLPDIGGDVTVLGLFGFTMRGLGDALVRLDLSIPDGEFVEGGS